MKIIQVDVFAVGLGAAILSQFRNKNGTIVSVLADGGVGPGDYQTDNVIKRLPEAWQSFEAGAQQNRIDLMIGTHYDGDHLKGLVPIAKDDAIQIGEVWLPPIKDDEDEIKGHISETADYLADKFYDDDDGSALLRYLAAKNAQLVEVQQYEMEAVSQLWRKHGRSFFSGRSARYRLEGHPQEILEQMQMRSANLSRREEYLAFFEEQEAEAMARTLTESAHGSATYDSSENDARDVARSIFQKRKSSSNQSHRLAGLGNSSRMQVLPIALANIRKSLAAKAITASHLHNLVQALRKRKRPVRPLCHFIPAGQPWRFVWRSDKGRFIRRANGGATEDLVLTLLGPSDKLVEKHQDKLPIGAYRIAFLTNRINLEAITESNQLSYILTLEKAGQRLLISGDAGCYGFKDDKKKYFSNLLRALSPLHVVQVAHHGGHNYDFYPTLLAAGFAEQKEFAYLLLSHAVNDRARPSQAFGNFIAQIRKQDDGVSLLFTSQPDAAKVEDYDELIYKVTPPNARDEQGDVRLSYADGNGNSTWSVERHAVSI